MKKRLLLGLLAGIGLAGFSLEAEAAGVAMHRLYNPNSGEHFYTADSSEKASLAAAGWEYEGIGWQAPASGDEVYRLYNPNAGDHHYTMNQEEVAFLEKSGWKNEDVGWYSDVAQEVPLFRAYNPNAQSGSHNYTVNTAEQQNLLSAGWLDEGISWYGVAGADDLAEKSTVTLVYVDSENNKLNASVTDTQAKGTVKRYTAPMISGYTLIGAPTITVTYKAEDQIVEFTYSKNASDLDTAAQEVRLAILTKINQHRVDNGRSILIHDDLYQKAGDIRAQEIVTLFSYTRPDGRESATVMADVGLSATDNAFTAENLGRWEISETLLADVDQLTSKIVAAWVKSDPHDAILLDAEQKTGAVGVYINKTAEGKYYIYYTFRSGHALT